MSKKKWGGPKAVNQDRAEALEFGVGMSMVGLQRCQVTDGVWHLIVGCYEFNINPLAILRKAMPNFAWEFHDLSDKKESEPALRARVVRSDFFWFTDVFYDRLVTARRVNSVEKPFMIIGHTFQSMRESCANDVEGMIRLLQSWGVREDREDHYSD